MRSRSLIMSFALLVSAGLQHTVSAAEWMTLSPDNHPGIVSESRTVKAFWGDYALRNDLITAAVADPERVSGRSSTRWAIPHVGGALIGLALCDHSRDFLTAYYPAPLRHRSVAPDYAASFRDDRKVADEPGREGASGERVVLKLPAYELDNGRLIKELERQPSQVRGEPRPYAEVRYIIEDGQPYLRVAVDYINPTDRPFEFDPQSVLRVDGDFETGLDFDGRLFYAWNPWHNTVYGVVAADDHYLVLAGRRYGGSLLGHQTAAGRNLVLPPGGSRQVVRYLVPGGDLFHVRAVAAELIGRRTTPLRLELQAPDGPVADALVTAFIGDRPAGAGRSDANGVLEMRLPDGRYTLNVAPFGRSQQTVTIDTAEDRENYRLDFESAAVVDVAVTDEQGVFIPCKVAFHGRDGTPDPVFFPASGNRRIRNLVYNETGRLRQVLPPGSYRVVITYGPEYDAVVRDVAVGEGETVDMRARLSRVVDTTGWISADMHNHSAISGFSEMFFVYPYNKCPSVDGDSIADPLGRVLNLLCENIEFAVPAEHNFIASYEPYLEELGMRDRMATAPGIGYTAGRRHTITHQNVFPMVHIPGMEDGGAPQRPQHVQQLAFMLDWYNRSEKIVQVAFPRSEPAGLQRDMHALDVQALEPIVDGKPIEGIDNRILEWIDLLNRGFRIPGVVGGGRFDNFHGSGALRNYISSSTADPAAIDPLEVVRAVKRGRVIMTTGPFLEVRLLAAEGYALPGDPLRVPDGRVETVVRIQCADWMQVDRVQILLNGERRADLDFTRGRHPDRFSGEAVQFEQTIPLTLARDTHVIVVASGQGPDYHARGNGPDGTRMHVAVSNPVYVDVGEPGFSPHSPLDDAVFSSLDFLIPLLTAPGAEPGRVRLTLRNRGDAVADDTVALQALPTAAVRILEPVEQDYRIEPGGVATLDWQLVFADDFRKANFPISSTYHNVGGFGVRIGRSERFPGRRPAARHMAADIPIASLAPIVTLDRIADRLAAEPAFPLAARGTRPWAWNRFAVAGDYLVVDADVHDANPVRHDVITEGACLEVFAAMDGRHPDNTVPGNHYPVRQVYLVPALDGEPAAAFAGSQLEMTVVPAPDVRLLSERTDQGYRIRALIPLELLGLELDDLPTEWHFGGMMTPVRLLGVPPLAGRFLLESRVSARQPNGNVRRAAIFNAAMPFRYHYQFGRMRLHGSVRADTEMVSPLSAEPDGLPARVRLRLHNFSDRPVSDMLTLRLEPEGAARLIGASELAFDLQPGETGEYEIRLALEPDAVVSAVELVATRTPQGHVVPESLLTLNVLDRPLDVIPATVDLETIPEALAERTPLRIMIDGNVMAEIRIARAGGDLALSAIVTDRHVRPHAVPWRGSCLEVFGSLPDRDAIGQVFLSPGAGETMARGFRSEQGRIVPAPDIRVSSTVGAEGYRLQALIPLERLSVDFDAERMQLELQLTTSAARGEPFVRGTVFGSPRAYEDAVQYGVFRKR